LALLAISCGRFGYDNIEPGAAIDAGVMVVVRTAVRVTTDPDDSDGPRLVRSGAGYALVWRDTRDGPEEEIYFALVDADGQKIASEVNVSNTAKQSDDPSIAVGDGGFGVSWTEGLDIDREIMFAILGPNGTPTQVVPITSSLGVSAYSSTAWTGTDYAIVWDDDVGGDRQIYLARVDAAGTVTMPATRITSMNADGARHPAAVSAPNGLAIVWQDFRNGPSEIYYGRFDFNGTLQGSEVNLSMAGNSSRSASISKAGNDVATAFEDDRELPRDPYLKVFRPDGTEKSSPLRLINDARDTSSPVVAFDGVYYGIVWKEGGSDSGEVLFALATDSEVVAVKSISAELDAEAPWIIFDGERFAVVWKDERSGADDVYFAHIDVVR